MEGPRQASAAHLALNCRIWSQSDVDRTFDIELKAMLPSAPVKQTTSADSCMKNCDAPESPLTRVGSLGAIGMHRI
jgi:hypothetical protein